MASGLEGIARVDQLDLKGKRVFLRLDLNVPLTEDGKISDETRIKAALPTIQHVIAEGGKLVMASHLGRPKKPEDRAKYSLEPVATRLSELLEKEVILLEDPAGDGPKGLLATMRDDQVILLENLRFHPDETKNGRTLPSAILEYTDVYVNDAFGACHRAHASIVGLNSEVSQQGVGFLISKEVEFLDQVLENHEAPFVAILGGAKVSDKIGVIENLIDEVDTFIIGGAMAYTFLAGQGVPVGKSLVEENKKRFALELIERVKARGKKILLPMDHVIVPEFSEKSKKKVTSGSGIAEDWMAVDIGPKTIAQYAEEIAQAKTVFWNGPMGVFEVEEYASGTFSVAEAVANSASTSIIGGGDSASAVAASGLTEKMTHISTGGGASLEYLQGDALPGLEALREFSKKKGTEAPDLVTPE